MTDKKLEVGDVVEGNTSWRIESLSDDFTCVHVDQNTKLAIPGNCASGYVVNYDGGQISNLEYVGKKASNGEPLTLTHLVRENNISVHDKTFVVTMAHEHNAGGSYGGVRAHKVYLQALDENGEFDPNGLKVTFFHGGNLNTKVFDVKSVGKMQQTFVKPQI